MIEAAYRNEKWPRAKPMEQLEQTQKIPRMNHQKRARLRADAAGVPEAGIAKSRYKYLRRIDVGGVPASLAQIQRMAQIVAPELLEELYDLARNAKAENVRAAAIGMIFDRAYGKPNQPLEVTSDTSALPLEDRERLISMLAAIVPAPGAPMIEGTLAPAPAPAALEPSKRKRKAK